MQSTNFHAIPRILSKSSHADDKLLVIQFSPSVFTKPRISILPVVEEKLHRCGTRFSRALRRGTMEPTHEPAPNRFVREIATNSEFLQFFVLLASHALNETSTFISKACVWAFDVANPCNVDAVRWRLHCESFLVHHKGYYDGEEN